MLRKVRQKKTALRNMQRMSKTDTWQKKMQTLVQTLFYKKVNKTKKILATTISTVQYSYNANGYNKQFALPYEYILILSV